MPERILDRTYDLDAPAVSLTCARAEVNSIFALPAVHSFSPRQDRLNIATDSGAVAPNRLN